MRDFEQEHTTRNSLKNPANEVAPNQFECAPILKKLIWPLIHTFFLMDIKTRVAKNHQLTVLLHEKPFARINGSGKNNNWSMATNTGVNLLSGRTPNKPMFLISL